MTVMLGTRDSHRWINSVSRWNVRGWPTIYVLDHNGVIRFKNVRGPKMDEAVDKLLAEMEDTD